MFRITVEMEQKLSEKGNENNVNQLLLLQHVGLPLRLPTFIDLFKNIYHYNRFIYGLKGNVKHEHVSYQPFTILVTLKVFSSFNIG